MPNTTEETANQSDWHATLHRMEKIRDELHRPTTKLPPPRRQPLEAEFLDLQEQLPNEVLLAVRTRLKSTQPLLASAAGGRCSACFVSLPRGDHTALLTGDKVVSCQYCGSLLYADEGERRRVAGLREKGGRKNVSNA